MTRHIAKILLCIVLLAAGGITFGHVYMTPHRPHHAAPAFSRPKPPAVHHPVLHPHHIVHHPKPHPPTWPYWMTFMGMQHFRPAPPPPLPLPLVYARPPQQIWVAGHYEDQVTVVNGVRVVQRVWIPGQWMTVP